MKILWKLVFCVSVLSFLLLFHTFVRSINDGNNLLLVNTTSSLSHLLEVQDKCKKYSNSFISIIRNSTSRVKVKNGSRNASKTIVQVPPPITRFMNPLKQEDIDSVKKFVFFIGYARSGHSIVASILDAHPNVILAHEFNLFRVWLGDEGSKLSNRTYLYNKLWDNSHNAIKGKGWRSTKSDKKGYSLSIDSPWQGNFRKLQVIGDKSGGVTAQAYINTTDKFNSILDNLKKTVKVPIKVIHVVRNPYDIASTRLLYMDNGRKSKLNATVDRKLCDMRQLQKQVNRTITLTTHVNEFLRTTDLEVLDVHLVDIIEDQHRTLHALCNFLGIDCSPEYLTACANKLYKKVSRTRNAVIWPEELIDKIYLDIIKPFPSFWRYSFNGH